MKIINFSENNSLLTHFLREIRDVNIQDDRLRFRRNLERIAEIMAYEISKELKYNEVDIATPLEKTKAYQIGEEIVLATILRAGIPFHQGMLNYFDNAGNAFVSAYRKYHELKKDHLEVHVEYIASPSIENKTLIITDPMLATGISMEMAYKALLTKGAPSHIHIATIVASQESINYCAKHFPNDRTTIWAAAIDPHLNESSYIVPGLGDAGDLAYGEK